ncbi:hypothetical protein, partial [Rhizobium leguminosarum]|uniref:hypothetical protein n=1 Tax=Rhizobium leguminosarum TaxID=384 RepID=UPI003F99D2C3
ARDHYPGGTVRDLAHRVALRRSLYRRLDHEARDQALDIHRKRELSNIGWGDLPTHLRRRAKLSD